MKLIIILKSKIRGLVVESLCDVLEALCSSPIIRELIDELNASDKNWRCNPVVEYQPSMHRALGPVPSITKSECGGTHPSIILVLRRQRQEGGSEVQGQPWQCAEFKACLKCKRRKTTMSKKKSCFETAGPSSREGLVHISCVLRSPDPWLHEVDRDKHTCYTGFEEGAETTPCPCPASDNQVSAWMAACGQVFWLRWGSWSQTRNSRHRDQQ